MRACLGDARLDGRQRGRAIEVRADEGRAILVFGARAVSPVAEVGEAVLRSRLPRFQPLGLVPERLRHAENGARVRELHHHVQVVGRWTAGVRDVAVVHDARVPFGRQRLDAPVHLVH